MDKSVFDNEIIMYAIVNADGVVQQGCISYDYEEVLEWFNDAYLPDDQFCISEISINHVGYMTNFTS